MSEPRSPFTVVRNRTEGVSPLANAQTALAASREVARVALAEAMTRAEVLRADLAGLAALESLPPGARDLADRLAKNIESSAVAMTQLMSRV